MIKKRSIRSEIADGLENLRAKLSNRHYELLVILLDQDGNRSSEALDACRELRPDTPILVIYTDRITNQLLELVRKGINECLPLNASDAHIEKVFTSLFPDRNHADQTSQTDHNYKEFFRNSIDGLIIGRPGASGEVLEANKAILDLLGYTRDEFLKMHREDFLDMRSAEGLKALKDRERNQNVSGRIKLIHKDGHHIPVELSSVIAEDDQKEKISYTIIRDIRNKVESENQIELRNRILELHSDINEILNRSFAFKKTLDIAVERIRVFLGWEFAHVYLRKHNDHSPSYHSAQIWKSTDHHKHESIIQETSQKTFDEDEGYIGKVASNNKALTLHTAKTDETEFHRLESITQAGLKTGYFLPVHAFGHTQAVLEFYTSGQTEPETEVQDALLSVCGQISRLFERQKHMKRISKEKQRYKLLAENASDMISRLDPEGRYLYVSPACKEITGYKPWELVGTSFEEIIQPDDQTDVSREVRALIEDKQEVNRATYRIQTSGDTVKWVETTYRRVNSTISGSEYEIQATTRDITDRVQKESELLYQVDLNAFIINNLPGIFFKISRDGKLSRVNDKLLEALHYEREEMLGKDPVNFISPAYKEKAASTIEEVFEKGHAEVELHLQNKEGKDIPFLITALSVSLRDRNFLLGMGISIEERITIDKELRKEKQFTDIALNSLPGLFYVLDEDLNYVRVNQNFIDDLGYPWEEVQQMLPPEFYLEEDIKEMAEAIKTVFETGEGSLISRVRTKDGSTPYYYLTGKRLEQDGKKFIMGTGIDITDQVETEILMKNSLREKEVLLTEVHHRVKNNLALVSSMLQLQAFESDNKEVVDALDNSHQRIRSLAMLHELIYRSDDFSKVDLHDQVNRLLDSVEVSLKKEKTIELERQLEHISVNLNQAVPYTLICNELMTNIHKHAFADQKNGMVRFRLFSSGEKIITEISDNGSGFPEDMDPHGTQSIGMSLVNSLADQLKADLKFESKKNEGLKVSLSFVPQDVKGSSSHFI